MGRSAPYLTPGNMRIGTVNNFHYCRTKARISTVDMDTWPHVETGPCHASWCDWSGFHWHWKVQRFRTMRELDRFQVAEMNEDLLEVYPSTKLP